MQNSWTACFVSQTVCKTSSWENTNLFSEESILLAFPSVKTVLPPTTKDKDLNQINSFRHSKLLKNSVCTLFYFLLPGKKKIFKFICFSPREKVWSQKIFFLFLRKVWSLIFFCKSECKKNEMARNCFYFFFNVDWVISGKAK